jgi:hypothetical protein
MSAHFKDADGVVHSIPEYLTHFVPNDRSDPYVLEKITVAYASGAKKEHRVHREYFDALVGFADETAPTYPGKLVPGLQMGEFVRFIGSRIAIPAITNYLLKHGSMASILLHRLRGVWEGPDVQFSANTCDDTANCYFCFTRGTEIVRIAISTRDEYVATLSTIVDECEHHREIVDFVRDATNETYAEKLRPFMMSITGDESVLYKVNPLISSFTMGWFVRELYKVPQHVVDESVNEH